jgi:hypothetical protein
MPDTLTQLWNSVNDLAEKGDWVVQAVPRSLSPRCGFISEVRVAWSGCIYCFTVQAVVTYAESRASGAVACGRLHPRSTACRRCFGLHSARLDRVWKWILHHCKVCCNVGTWYALFFVRSLLKRHCPSDAAVVSDGALLGSIAQIVPLPLSWLPSERLLMMSCTRFIPSTQRLQQRCWMR